MGGGDPRVCANSKAAAMLPVTHGLQRELGRLRLEYQELEATSAERDAGDELVFHDTQLQRLKLGTQLQRCQERGVPSLEDFAERYEAEIDELMEEVFRLQEENAALGARGTDDPGGGQQVSGASGATGVRTASEELCDEVLRMRRRQGESRRRTRRAQLEEWRLGCLRGEAQRVMKQLKVQERQLEELRSRKTKAEAYLGEVREVTAQWRRELERERAAIRDLHAQASGLREVCYLPARLKRESGFLVRMLDQEGGRLKTRRYLQGLQVCKKLYDEVAAKAPSLLPLAGRARSEMEAEFTRYMKLEESHGQTLQRLHLAVTRGLLPRDHGDGRSSIY